ncbi:reverse transcriptase domain-containing protein [Tanacetum coccineum]|uniref:Reverse transcriptase domain-containing protein n=1 Tax=Tanacetum coccineum TaxID=301880 RepID=A0ABQ5CPA0_9ASTR
MSVTAIKRLISQCVADALLDYEVNQNSGNRNENENGNRNGNGNDNGNGSQVSGSGRTLHTARGNTYKEFLNCQPLNFKRTEGAVRLAHWFEKMEYVFHISNFAVECQVKYATCTLRGNVTSSKPTRLQEAIQIANSLMDQKVRVYAARQADNKKIMENNLRDNHAQQPPYKRQNIARAYTAGPSEKKEYVGTLPLCNKCKLHHNGSCTVKFANYKKVGHMAWDCRSPTAAADQRTLTCFEFGNQGHYHSECPRLKNQIMGIKSKMVKLVEGCMLWEEEKPIKTLTSLQIIVMLKERSFLSCR